MSNWPPPISGAHTELLGAGTGTGTTVDDGAINAKGTPVTIGTTTTAWAGFVLYVRGLTGANARRFRLDVLINTGGSDQVIVADLYFEGSSNYRGTIYFPIAVPSGATVKCALQSSSTDGSCLVYVLGIAADMPGSCGHARVVSCTDWGSTTLPANSVTQTGQTFTAWTEIMASTPNRIARLYLHSSTAGDSTRTASDVLVEIGVGSAGNEKVIGSYIDDQSNANFSSAPLHEIPCDIPAGSRLAFRVQCANTAAADAMSVAAMGLVA